jgi:hypothetical protein
MPSTIDSATGHSFSAGSLAYKIGTLDHHLDLYGDRF